MVETQIAARQAEGPDLESLYAKICENLPTLLFADPGFREEVLRISRDAYSRHEEFDARFERTLEELRQDRIEQRRKWDEQDRKWHEQHQENMAMLAEIRKSRQHQEQQLGVMGARWGTASEESFRAALKAILEESFAVEVLNINDFDEEGLVFGRPDQVEIDVIIKNGETILCELKSSMSKGDAYLFERKVHFYESRYGRKVSRKLIVSPMVHPSARAVADQLGIEVHTFADEAAL